MRIGQPHVPAGAGKDRGPGPADQAGADDGDVAFSVCHFILSSHSQSTLRRRSRSSRKRLGRPLMDHPAALQRHRGIGQRQRQIEMVIDDDDGDFLAQPVEGLEQLLDHGRRQALEGLVEQQHPHVARQRARHRDHLLLAAGEIIRRAVEPLANAREIFVDALAGPVHAVAGLALQPAEFEILLDAHAGEQAAALRHIADAEPRDSAPTNCPISSLSAELDRSVRGRRDADQRLEQRRLAGAVAAQQRDDLVLVQREVDVVEDVALAVERIDIVDRQQRVDAGGGLARACGDCGGAGTDIDFLHLRAGCAHPRPCRRAAPGLRSSR